MTLSKTTMTMTNQEFIESIRLEGEEWKPIIGYEESYMVSSFGRVLRLTQILKGGHQSTRVTKPKIMKLFLNEHGYYYVDLYKNKSKKRKMVHRLVATVFIPNLNSKPEIDHIDTNRTNNRVDNLRWCSKSENQRNPITQRKKAALRLGKPFPQRYVPIVSVDKNGIVKHYNSFIQASREGHDRSHVRCVCTGKAKSYHGLKWMYLSEWETLIKQDVKEQS